MRTYRKMKRKAGPAQNAPPLEPLDDAQLNAVMRNVFAWMTVGFGITATVARAFLASPIYPDLAGFIFIIIAHLAIAFTLDRKLRRYSPKQAGAFFIVYSALTGFTLSVVFFMLFNPTISSALVTACTSTGCLFGLMTLIGWRTRLDFCRARSYVLMALLGLLTAYLVNKLLAGAFFDYVFSFFSVILFSALAASHRDPINALSTDPDLRIKSADSLRFSLLAALQLYVTAGNMFVIALSSGRVGGGRYFHADLQPLLRPRHGRGMGIGSGYGGYGGYGSGGGAGIGSGGAGGGGGVGGGGAGGGGSFTP